jgi:hypothetical protein
MGTGDPDPGARSNPMAATGRQSPSSRRAALNTSLVLAGCGVVELLAWSLAWALDWQTGALVGAVAVSMGVAGVIVGITRRRD